MAIAEMIPEGALVADIGTDHGFLPVYLAKSGKAERAFACDIAQKPLNSAARTILKYGAARQVAPLLSNGLEKLEPNQVDCIVIAGMGGITISEIIENCRWARRYKFDWFLQPMTKAPQLRQYLCRNGFKISSEKAVMDKGRIYTVIAAKYIGQKFEPDDIFALTGMVSKTPGELQTAYINKTIQKLRKKQRGLALSADSGETDRIGAIIQSLEKITEGAG
ncbi:MAG: class I SAM-dependent methyltransferase [Oscillospiraceae bacterium]|jgi:tRNA (adenine22-N1)-methyltransferase|nr:class I SAM-dependent methyltransferase [Oscillospiraceae bacterium]